MKISGQSSYDMMSSEHITLLRRVVQIEYEILTESMNYFISNASSIHDLLFDEGWECGTARFDEADLTEVLYDLEVFNGLNDSNAKSLAQILLLKAATKANVYYKVGTGCLDGHLFGNKPEERITII